MTDNNPTTPPADVAEAPRAGWRDMGSHEWELRPSVDCVECPHCCFTFAAVHTDGNSDGYSCPNCKGCPDDNTRATPADLTERARRVESRVAFELSEAGVDIHWLREGWLAAIIVAEFTGGEGENKS